MASIPHGNLPLRVNQLDAAVYDNDIYDILWVKLQEIVKYLKSSALLHTYVHETKATIKLILWLVVFRRHHATLGQQLLGLKYTPSRQKVEGQLAMITKVQSLFYLLCNVVIPYASSKLNEWSNHRQFSVQYPLVSNAHAVLNGLWCCLNLTNFIIFLCRGSYLHLYERLCGIRAVHPEGRQLREVGFEFFNREIIWHGFAEFMIFISPYINLSKFKSWISPSSVQLSEGSRYCVVCNSYPTNPQQISGCSHVYCYHCAATLLASDGMLECKLCDVKIRDADSLLPAVHRVDNST